MISLIIGSIRPSLYLDRTIFEATSIKHHACYVLIQVIK